MLSHNQIKYINSLKIKKFRQQYNAFIIEGEKGVNELLESQIKPVKLFALQEWIKTNSPKLRKKNIEIQEVSEDELKKVSDLNTPNQVLAVAEIPETGTPVLTQLSGMALALDGIRDPGNMGTIIRTADWFGIKTIFCSSDSVDMYNPKVIQSTMGSFSRLNVFYVNLPDFFKTLPQSTPVFGAVLEGPDITTQTFAKPGIILIGNEAHGIAKSLIPFINVPLHIPHLSGNGEKNKAESLNASIANGIICYEICKQLTKNNY
jgi:RNA methyltransferase, TrmH family